MVIMIN